MSRAKHRRLKKLEQRQPDPGRWHRIMGHSEEELAAKEAELKTSNVWREGDHIIAIRFVSAKQVLAEDAAVGGRLRDEHATCSVHSRQWRPANQSAR